MKKLRILKTIHFRNQGQMSHLCVILLCYVEFFLLILLNEGHVKSFKIVENLFMWVLYFWRYGCPNIEGQAN